MKIERYKAFDRIYPKLRLSPSLYKVWIKNDWAGVWAYLTRTERRSNKAMNTGRLGHSYMELNPPAELVKIVGEGEGSNEQKIVADRGAYYIVGQLDRLVNDYVIDYKFGGRNGYEDQLQLYMDLADKKRALLVQCAPIWDGPNVVGAKILHVHEYRRNKKRIEYLRLAFDEMANTINYQINAGYLEDYIRANLY